MRCASSWANGELLGVQRLSSYHDPRTAPGPSRLPTTRTAVAGLIEQSIRFPVWFEPLASGSTPMCQALREARACIVDFISRTPRCFPPIILHLTDGEATDGDPEPDAEELRSLSTSDGPVL